MSHVLPCTIDRKRLLVIFVITTGAFLIGYNILALNMRNTNPQRNASLPFKSNNVSRGKDEKRISLQGVKLPDKSVSRRNDRYLSATLPVKPTTVSRVKGGNMSAGLPVKPSTVSRVKYGNMTAGLPVKRTTVSRVKDGNLSAAFPVKLTTVSRVKGGNLSAALPVKLTTVSRVKDGNLSTALPVKVTTVSRVKGGNISAVKLTGVSPGKEGKKLILNQKRSVNSSGVKATPNPVPIDVNITLYDPTLCDSCPGLRWVFYVHSAPEHRHKRDLIRVTWGNPAWHRPGTTRLVFMLGQTSGPEKQLDISEEHRQHGDIVQGDFVDSYRNLTLKAMLALKWATMHCKNAVFFLKSDDDIVFNIFKWKQLAERLSRQHSRLLMCVIYEGMGIVRDRPEKWRVDPGDFPGQNVYPKYCAGWAWTFSAQVIPELYHAAANTPFFWIDDVFITGLAAGKLKDLHYENVRLTIQNAVNQSMVAVHTNTEHFTKLWALFLRWHQWTGKPPVGSKTFPVTTSAIN